MQKNLKETDSYKREGPADKNTKDEIVLDKTLNKEHTPDKDVTTKDTINKGTEFQGLISAGTRAAKESARTTPAGAGEKTRDGYSPEIHARDANSHTIFSNRKLTCQFLRDYTGLSIFKDLQPEDIEDVTERYKAFLGIQFESDTVKKVRIRLDVGEKDVFVLPLVEHKTDVDYDVAMQLLRYMAVIWYDYKKQQESLKEGSSGRKSFRYPPIIPIVYYEGRENWTAGLHLSDRIDLSYGLTEYIPDFTYKLVRVHGYGNEDLRKKQDEMSLVMMINRIQGPEDFTELLNTSRDYVDMIYNGATEDIKEVYQDILWSLFRKMNVPVEEARNKLAKLEDSGMGNLFASMEKMDIQAERRNTQIARQEAEAAKQELEKANLKLKESNQELQDTSARLNAVFGQLVSICQGNRMSREETLECLQKQYGLSETEAALSIEHFWNPGELGQ